MTVFLFLLLFFVIFCAVVGYLALLCLTSGGYYIVRECSWWHSIERSVQIVILTTGPIWIIFWILYHVAGYVGMFFSGIFKIVSAICQRDITKVFKK